MRRRRGQKMGCCELAVIVFALFVAFQFAMLGLRVLHEILVFAGTLVKWVGVGIAGAVGIAALSALVFGTGYAVTKVFKGLFGRGASGRERPSKTRSYCRQGREWRGGIKKTVRELQKRGWISRDDGKRYRESADSAVARLRVLERDLATLRSLPATDEWAQKVDEAAKTIVQRLERTHRALARLLAESALQEAPTVDMDLRDAADELESLVAALEDINGASPVSEAARHASVPSKAGDAPVVEESPIDEVIE